VAADGRGSEVPLTRVPACARVVAYGAAAWALGFAGVNIYLQIVGIDSEQIQRNWTAFTIANLGVVVLKLVGAAVALATVQAAGAGGCRHRCWPLAPGVRRACSCYTPSPGCCRRSRLML
jgi:hypothetical protein